VLPVKVYCLDHGRGEDVITLLKAGLTVYNDDDPTHPARFSLLYPLGEALEAEVRERKEERKSDEW